MTLVVAWLHHEEEQFWCVADTRLSNSGGVITDSGPKVFEVPVVLNEYCEKQNTWWKVNARYTFGFAFAGSSLAALATHVRATSCTMNLRLDREIPAAEQSLNLARIAMLYCEIATLQIKEMCLRMGLSQDPKSAFFEGLVFGYCPVEHRYRAFILKPEFKAGEFMMAVGEVDALTPNNCIVLGSGRDRFFERCREPRKENEGIADIVKSIIDEDERPDVGGYLQVGICSPDGFKNVPILQTGPNRDGVEVNFLGYDVSKYKHILGFDVGYYAIHMPD